MIALFSNFTFLSVLDLLVAIVLLAVGLLRGSVVLYVGSLAALAVAVVACLISFANFEAAGVVLLLFGVACLAMSRFHRATTVLSNRSLGQTGGVFILLGVFASLLI